MRLRSGSCRRLAVWPAGQLEWVSIGQDFESRAIPSPAEALLARLDAASGSIGRGDRVAVAIGSRGISSIVEVTRCIVGWLRSQEAHPFIVPAMGSHGGASAKGQAKVLESLGITESTVAAPILSGMETVRLGNTSDGVAVFTDRHACGADAVIPVARVKPHTDFHGRVESGPAKMLAVGLGNRTGAEAIHGVGLTRLSETIAQAAQVVIHRMKVPFCVAIVEDAFDSAAIVEVVPSRALVDREPQLLALAREWMPSLPVAELDVLVVQELGKNISGDGMDPNITGRFYDPQFGTGQTVRRLVALDLTAETNGNATGVGMADVVTTRLANRVNWQQTYTNEVTSNTPHGARLPLVALDDEEAFAVAVKTLGAIPPAQVRLAWIKNTLSLSRLLVTVPVLDSPLGRVRVLSERAAIDFDDGVLMRPSSYST